MMLYTSMRVIWTPGGMNVGLVGGMLAALRWCSWIIWTISFWSCPSTTRSLIHSRTLSGMRLFAQYSRVLTVCPWCWKRHTITTMSLPTSCVAVNEAGHPILIDARRDRRLPGARLGLRRSRGLPEWSHT